MTSDVAVRPPAVRGRTVIDDRVRQRLIERAALSVPGVVARRTIVPGRSLPAITVSNDRGSGAVEIQIATIWPVDSAVTVAAVRAEVVRELASSLAEYPERVDVVIARVDADRTPAEVADAYARAGTYVVEDDHGPAAGVEPRRFAPRAVGPAGVVSVLIALTLIGAGAVFIREALTPADSWITPILGWVSNAHWQFWFWPAAVLAGLMGLVLLVAAITPRRRTHISVGDGIWVPRANSGEWALSATEGARRHDEKDSR
jgi:hypothetical protein